MWFLTYTGGICNCFRSMPMPLILFTHQTNTRASTQQGAGWDGQRSNDQKTTWGNFFYCLFFIVSNNFLHLPPFLFCCAGRIIPFHPFLSKTEMFPSSLHMCWRPLMGGCPNNLSLASALTHNSASPEMETACWGQGQGYWDQSCLGWWEGLGTWGFCMLYAGLSGRRTVLGGVWKGKFGISAEKDRKYWGRGRSDSKIHNENEDWSVLIGNWLLWGRTVEKVSFEKHFSTCIYLCFILNQIVHAEQNMCLNSVESLQPTKEIKAFCSSHYTIIGKELMLHWKKPSSI